jgi:hypothetical protein
LAKIVVAFVPGDGMGVSAPNPKRSGVLVRKDCAMKYDVVVETAQEELVAAVRARVPISGIARAWKPALDQVWAFLKTAGGLNPGHNLFLYHHPERRNDAMNIDFGVEVGRPFEPQGDVRCIETRLVRSQGQFMSVPTID